MNPKKNYTDKSQAEKHKEVMKIKNDLRNYARSMWGKKWVESILKYGRPYRMRRALIYAKEERMSNLIISTGKIFSTVQGTAPTPYRVNINFKPIPESGWKKIMNVIANKSKYIIQLLDNVMPKEFIPIFKEKGYSLFPKNTRNLNASCSCPDKEVPCKHIASTILYIARVVDFDPFILLKLKGKKRSEFIQMINELRNQKNTLLGETRDQKRQYPDQKKKEIKKKDFNVPVVLAKNIEHNKKRFTEGDPLEVGFRILQPRKNIETLDTMGLPENLERPDTFDLVFRNIYYKTVKDTYKMAENLDREK